MTKTQALDYLEQLNTYGSRPGLDSIIELCNRLGNPQDELSFVHIAGTNGKGSIAAYTTQMLVKAGYQVGRYVSPTISDYRERFTVNGRMITQKDLYHYLDLMKQACDEMVADGFNHPTVFEVETALGFLYFRDRKCDIVVLECGMGGELDATNLIQTTKVVAFANIGLDHMAFLGKTIEEIAVNKAGVIKTGCKIVSYPQEDNVTDVIIGKAHKMGIIDSDINVINRDDFRLVKQKLNKQIFSTATRKGLTISMNGVHQCYNAMVAIGVIDALNNSGYQVSEKAILAGLAETTWPARLEVIDKKPMFLIDGAHNPQGARVLREALDTYFKDQKFTFLIGVFADKDYEQILDIMCDLPQRVITLKTPNNARALDAVSLAEAVLPHCRNVTAAGSIEEAVEMAYLLTPKDEMIVAFGSLSYLGQLKQLVNKRKK